MRERETVYLTDMAAAYALAYPVATAASISASQIRMVHGQVFVEGGAPSGAQVDDR